MMASSLRLTRIFCAALCATIPIVAWTQQAEESTESEAAPEALRPVVLYMDTPAIFSGDQEPVLSPLPVPTDPEADPEFPTRAASILDYNDRITQIESSGGAWDSNLIESLAALGNLHQSQGEYEAAIAALDRALHISRINNGLNTSNQIELIEQLIESHLALENWESADLYHDYLFYIQEKAYGVNDPSMIPALDELGNWHVQAFRRGVGDPLGMRLSTAIILFNSAARLSRELDALDDARFVAYQHSIANTAYLMVSNADLMGELDRSQYRSQLDQLRDRLMEDSEFLQGGFQAGEQALLEVIALLTDSADSEALAEAYINLGDWYLLAERRRRAEEQYAVAWDLLVVPAETGQAAADSDQQASVAPVPAFSRISIIPSFIQHGRWLNRPGLERPPLSSLQAEEVDLSFTVTRSGLVRDIEVLSEETEENAGHFARISRELRRFRFRPMLVDGQMTETQNNRARVRFWY